jgi:hypothetical protein
MNARRARRHDEIAYTRPHVERCNVRSDHAHNSSACVARRQRDVAH